MDCEKDIFRRHGLRCTRQRQVLYEELAATAMHPTAEELHQSVRTREPGISLATVYNTLEAFCACGLANKLPAPDGRGPCRYDATTEDHAHVVLADGRVLDMPADLSVEALQRVKDGLLAELCDRLGLDGASLRIQVVVRESD